MGWVMWLRRVWSRWTWRRRAKASLRVSASGSGASARVRAKAMKTRVMRTIGIMMTWMRMMMNTSVIVLNHVIVIPIVLIALVFIALVKRAKVSGMGERG